MTKQLTGRHVFLITATAFGIIIAVNVTMAVKAVKTFPGLEVKNSYVASQQFQSQRDAQEKLGWQVRPVYEQGYLTLTFNDAAGQPVSVRDLQVLVGRTTEAQDDARPQFLVEDGRYVAPIELAQGKWMLRVQAKSADGTLFHQRLDLHVRG